MESLDKIIAHPLKVVQDDFERTGKFLLSNVTEYFRLFFDKEDSLSKVPSLNDVGTQYLPPNSLVQIRCMIQDMHDPEYAMGVYETRNTKSGEKKLRLGIFKEISDCEVNEEIVFDSPNAVTVERQNLYCVPVPGESQWAKECYSERSTFTLENASAETSGLKRQRSSGNEMETDSSETVDGPLTINVEASKRHRTVTDSSAHSTSPTDGVSNTSGFDFNFPLPGDEGTPCIVTVYENQENYKLNEIYELIGILSVDPALAKPSMSQAKQEAEVSLWPETISQEERSALYPPPSLVPRLHCLCARRLDYHCPLLTTVKCENVEEVPSPPENIPSIRAELMQILTRLLYGDELAAEYLLMNIIGRVYGRADVLALGKFSLNISNCKDTKDPNCPLGRDIHDFIAALVPKSFYFPLRVQDLNTMKVIPKKDYQSNRLISGILQVPNGTHFVLDETAMEPGQLEQQGVKNITAIGNLIQWQKVDYDFSFQQCEILTDVPVVVISEGKSLFQCDCLIPLRKKDHSSPSALSLLSNVSKLLLDKIRSYLAYVRYLKYDLSTEIQEQLKEDFTHTREMDSKSMDAEIFQLLLVTSRLYSLSYGRQELTLSSWSKVKTMDTTRRQRIAAMNGGQS